MAMTRVDLPLPLRFSTISRLPPFPISVMIIEVNSAMLGDLQTLLMEVKFNESDYYDGAPTEEIRAECEAKVNGFIQQVMLKLRQDAEPEDIFVLGRKLVAEFDEDETIDEAERADDYIGEVMTILEIEDWADHV